MLSYSSEGSVITVLILHWGPQAPYQLVEEQHGLQNTSTNHPSVTIVYHNHMWLWCLFIIMRMKISSIWLLPHKLSSVWSTVCARALVPHFVHRYRNCSRSLTDNIQKLKIMNFQCQEFITAIFVPSCIEHSDTERTRNHFSLSGSAPEVIRSLDTIMPPLLFSPTLHLPQGNTQP